MAVLDEVRARRIKRAGVILAFGLVPYIGSYIYLSQHGRYEVNSWRMAGGPRSIGWAPKGFVREEVIIDGGERLVLHRWSTPPMIFYAPLAALDWRLWHPRPPRPEGLVWEAARLEANDPARKVAIEDVIKHFNIYRASYPDSEVESLSYIMAQALSRLEEFDEAVKVLRENVNEFAASPTVQNSQLLLALTLGAMAGKEMARPNPDTRAAEAQFDEAESLLTDLIKRNIDFALANEARFQLGELLWARAGFLRGDADPRTREAWRARAFEEYRSVAGKEQVLAAQKARIASFREQMLDADRNKDVTSFQKFRRIWGQEWERLAITQSKPDRAPAARSRLTD